MTILKPYPAYKDSGVNWIGHVPWHWDLFPMKRITRGSISGITPPSEEPRYYDNGSVAWYGPSNLGSGLLLKEPVRFLNEIAFAEGKARKFEGPALLVTIIGAPGKSALLETGEGSTNQQITAFQIDANAVVPRFLALQFRLSQEWIAANSSTSTIAIVDLPLVKNTPLALPPLDEQRAIADFLDGMDARITRFIAARRKMIALLEEKKQAVINQAVTRGLDSSVPMKDSGVDWLGEIPAHWEIAAIGRYWRVTDCKHVTVPFVEPNGDTYPLASVIQAQRFELDLTDAKHTTREWYEYLIDGGRKPQRGDLVFCRNVSVGSAALVTMEEPFAMGQDVCRLSTRSQDSRFLNYSLRGGPAGALIDRTLVGSTFKRINVAQIRAIRLPLPPIKEQALICTYLDCETSRIDELISRRRCEIELMQEYRTRLISDVVTGKLDVRGVELPAVEAVIGEEIEAAMEDEVVSAGELEGIEA